MIAALRSLLKLFDRAERKRIAFVLLTVLFRAVAEMVAVASILPFMAVASNPTLVQRNRWLHAAYSEMGFSSVSSFLVFLGVVVLAIMVISNAVAAFARWYMLRFVWAKNHALSVQLLERYLQEPFAFYLTRNTARLTKTLLGEVQSVTRGLLLPLVETCASLLVLLFVFGLLFALDAQLAVTMLLVVGGAYGIVYALVRRGQGRLGRVRIEMNRRRYQAANEAFGAIKDLKVSHREEFFLDRFREPSAIYSQTIASNLTIAQLPRYAIQALAFGGILVVVLYLLSTAQSLTAVLPLISLYALAAARMLPALQQVYSGIIEVRFNAPAVDVLCSDLARGSEMDEEAERRRLRPDGDFSFEREFALESVTFRYEGAAGAAVRDVSLSIRRNSTVGFIGPTGAGKTTVVDIILGLLTPSHGHLTVDGVPIDAGNMDSWQRLMGYVPQHIYLSDDTLRHNIAFGIADGEINEDRVQQAVAIANLEELVAELPKGLDSRVGERGIRLSGGQRQRIGIARALYNDPEVLVLDEATSALDGITESAVLSAITKLTNRKTIIVIAHRLTTVRDCEMIYLIESGQIRGQGTYRELLEKNGTVRAMASGGAPSSEIELEDGARGSHNIGIAR